MSQVGDLVACPCGQTHRADMFFGGIPVIACPLAKAGEARLVNLKHAGMREVCGAIVVTADGGAVILALGTAANWLSMTPAAARVLAEEILDRAGAAERT